MRTIKSKLILFITTILLFFVLGSITTNFLFLEKYYIYKNKKIFMHTFSEIKKINFKSENKKLQHLGVESGLEINIIDERLKIISSSKPGFNNKRGDRLGKESEERIKNFTKEYYYGISKSRDGVKKEIILLTSLDGKYFTLIKKPLKELIENARIANLFFIITGGILFGISIILATVLSNHFLVPINKINEIVKKISKLDFSQKFVSETRDEISDLGENINIISDKLNTTIKDLKTSNNKLEIEMDNQKLFFASISHEFKTPLGLIRGYSEAVQYNLADKTELTNTIIDEIDRLNILITDIAELIRFDRDNFKLQLSAENLTSIIRERLLHFEQNIEQNDINLIFESQDDIYLEIDLNRVLQLFDNLFSNAIKYVNNDKIINITLKKTNSEAILTIYNSSNPISQEKLDKLFDSFYRLEKDRSRETGGSGLGLAIVKKIVDSHKGKYMITNYDKGILVEIRLPIK